jgi:hypothetical protein
MPSSIAGILAIPLPAFLAKGFLILQPNIASVLVFFGRYAGTVRGGLIGIFVPELFPPLAAATVAWSLIGTARRNARKS